MQLPWLIIGQQGPQVAALDWRGWAERGTERDEEGNNVRGGQRGVRGGRNGQQSG